MHGPDVGRHLRATLRRMEEKATELRESRPRAEAELARLAASREEIFSRLAEVYLPELDEQAVHELQDQVPAIHARVRSILREKDEERGTLEETLERRAAERVRLESELDELTGRVEELARERDRLAERVTKKLEENPRYPELAKAVQQAESRHEQAERRHAAAVAERDEKVPEYESNLLFAYLLRRGYGTDEYRGRGLTRRLDGWVAGKVDFLRQLQNHRLLHEVPKFGERALANEARELGEHRGRIRETEKEVEDLYGLTQVVEKGDALYADRQELVERIQDVDSEIEKGGSRLTELETDRGRYYDQARDELAEFLGRHPSRSLRELASSTATSRDDAITRDLRRWESEWEAAQRAVREIREQEASHGAALDSLRKTESRFRRKDYDASNSNFDPGFDLQGLLSGLLQGVISTGALWKAIVRHQRFEPTRYEVAGPILETLLRGVLEGSGGGGWSGGGRSRRSRGRRTSGGFGGGRSRTTGGFGGFGGGSRTTGGFG